MKKLFIAGIISILACSANAASFKSNVAIAPVQAEVVEIHTATCAAKSPKVVKRGDRVIIIYKDGTTIVVDKNGDVNRIPAN